MGRQKWDLEEKLSASYSLAGKIETLVKYFEDTPDSKTKFFKELKVVVEDNSKKIKRQEARVYAHYLRRKDL